MKLLSVLAVAAAALSAVPAGAHDFWARPEVVEIDGPVWVNPGVYVSQYSDVTRNYPYVGCCLPAFENWSLARPYPRVRPARIVYEHAFVSHRRDIPEPPRAVDRLHYPDGRAIERFIDTPGRRR